MKTTTQLWDVSDIFLIRQKDGLWSGGQVLDRLMPNVVSCAFYDVRVADRVDLSLPLPPSALVALVSVTREGLDSGAWKVVDKAPIGVEKWRWPNEQFRSVGWIGAKIYGAAIVDDFLNAFYGLLPWDDWKDPNYLDRLLVSPEKKPAHLIYKGHH